MTDISDQQLSAVPLQANHVDAEITTIHIPLSSCCATSFYSICFSIIKYFGYWNSQTLDSITDHVNKICKVKLNGNIHPLTINNVPRTLQIYDGDMNSGARSAPSAHSVAPQLYEIVVTRQAKRIWTDDRTSVRPTVQGASFSMRGQLYHGFYLRHYVMEG